MLEYSNHSPHEIVVFDGNGSRFLNIDCRWLELPALTFVVYSPEQHGLPPRVLIGNALEIVAVNPSATQVCWRRTIRHCDIMPLPLHGVVMVSSDIGVSVLGLADGAELGSCSTDRAFSYGCADSESNLVFASLDEEPYSVHAWSWEPSASGPGAAAATGGTLVSLGPLIAAGEAGSRRPLAVMPPAPGTCFSHLIVGESEASEVRVLSLPGFTLVHTHMLEGMRVGSLLADPCGTALAVFDYASESTHLLAWPLPGMPQLE